jgi:hypothetical protein
METENCYWQRCLNLLVIVAFQTPQRNMTRAVEPPVLPVLGTQDTKRENKETTRYNALLCQTQNLVSTPALMRENQAAVTALMDLADPTSMKPKAVKMKKS